jgi:hypothetical protein
MPNQTRDCGPPINDSTYAEVATGTDDAREARSRRGRRLVRSILLVVAGFLLGALVPVAYGSFRSDSPSHGVPQPTTPAASGRVLDQFSFTSSPAQREGWKHYESAVEGVAFDLPANWGPFPTEEGGPNLIFDASDSYPFTGYGTALWVLKTDIGRTPSDAARYWSMWRRAIQTKPEVVGDVTMSTMTVPAGEMYVIHSVQRANGDDYTQTMYCLLRGSTEYRLIFGAAADGSIQYDVFDEVVRTLTIS